MADSLGSVRGTVNSAGALTSTTAYDAWGNPQAADGLTATTPFGFAGAYTDPTGLLYLINRYYDPAAGQFLSVDPEVGQTQDPYGYAAGNPVGNTDPSGMDPSEWPVNGYSCAQRFKWCDMFLKISPGAESSLVTYTAQRKVHGAWFSSISLYAYALCYGWEVCTSKKEHI